MIKKVAIIANGGDVAGFNAVIRGIVKTAENNGIECYGFIDGYNGLLKNDYVKLSTAEDGNAEGIVDTMNYIKCPVTTICVGLAASFGAVLLANGEKGKRFATPNSEILIHQPLIGGQGGGISGQATEIKIHAEHMIRTREKLNKLLSEKTGQSIETIERDTERDHYMTAQEALEYGLIDGIMDKRI